VRPEEKEEDVSGCVIWSFFLLGSGSEGGNSENESE
jgi:hypothetical protein